MYILLKLFSCFKLISLSLVISKIDKKVTTIKLLLYSLNSSVNSTFFFSFKIFLILFFRSFTLYSLLVILVFNGFSNLFRSKKKEKAFNKSLILTTLSLTIFSSI